MGLTVTQILACDSTTPELAGIAVDELATTVSDRHDDLATTIADLQDAWASGQARQPALDSATGLRRELELAQGGRPDLDQMRQLAQIGEERTGIDGKLKGIHSIQHRLADPDPTHPRAYLSGLSTADQGRAIVSIGNPDEIPNAGSGAYADRAVGDLSRFQDGLRVTHEGGAPSHNVVLGHSYGTTVVGHTASQAAINADDLIFVASPGVGVNNVTYLDGVPRDHIWATRADGDPIQWALDTRAHGPDPAQPGFGGNVFTSDPGGHSSYWDQDNPARDTIARIVTGRGGVQLCPEPDDWRPWLASH